MPTLVNRNAHGVRNGGYRLGAGEVRDVSGDEADVLSGISGVETAKKEDKEAADRHGSRSRSAEAPGQLRQVQAAAAEVRVQGRNLLVVIPLQTVIGDDAAPYGPPSGTVTTKQAIANESEIGSPDRKAFADHEFTPAEAEERELDEVQQGQADATAELEELQAALDEQAAEAESETKE